MHALSKIIKIYLKGVAGLSLISFSLFSFNICYRSIFPGFKKVLTDSLTLGDSDFIIIWRSASREKKSTKTTVFRPEFQSKTL